MVQPVKSGIAQAKPVRRLGIVDEDHRRGTLFQSCGRDRWREDRIYDWFRASYVSEPAARLAEYNNRSNKCKDGPQTFL